MEDQFIGLLVTIVIIALIVGAIMAAVENAVTTIEEFFNGIWVKIQQVIEAIKNWFEEISGGITLPPIEFPTPPTSVAGNPTPAPTPVEYTGPLLPGGQAIVGNTGGDRLNCRAEPSTDAAVVTKLEVGTIVTLIEQENGLGNNYIWWLVQPSTGPTCWTVENWLIPYGSPAATVTPAATSIATGTPTPAGNLTIAGTVTDGNGHSLADVTVFLYPLHSNVPLSQTTDENGRYKFNDLPPDGMYTIEVFLATKKDGVWRKETTYSKGLLDVRAAKPPYLAEAESEVTLNFDFADNDLITADHLTKSLLPAMADIYYQVTEFEQFAKTNLSFESFTPSPKIETFYAGATGKYDPKTNSLRFGLDESALNYGPSPTGLEWHETAHHLMNLVMEESLGNIMDDYGQFLDKDNDCAITTSNNPSATKFTNHGGYSNCYSGDGWAEGWAEFWACAKEKPLSTETCHYNIGDATIDLDKNWKVWDLGANKDGEVSTCPRGVGGCNTPLEEYAVASLLWDLYDPKDSSDDDDQIDLTGQMLIQTFENAADNGTSLTNMHQVYQVLDEARLTLRNEDGSKIPQENLDKIFTNHGFCYDKNRNSKCEDGELPGYAGAHKNKNETPRY